MRHVWKMAQFGNGVDTPPDVAVAGRKQVEVFASKDNRQAVMQISHESKSLLAQQSHQVAHLLSLSPSLFPLARCEQR